MIKYDRLRQLLSEGNPCHIYSKGIDSRVIFYSVEDFILFFTMFSSFIRQTDIVCIAFCIMFNHYHSGLLCNDASELSSFIDKLESFFSREYNIEHGSSGPVFKKQFGRSVKYVGKKIKGMLVYIANNPVAGMLKNSAAEYKWNPVAYKDNKFPFSDPLPAKRKMRKAVKDSVTLIDVVYNSGGYLNYALQRRIFEGLSLSEKGQIIDYIISKYNFIDYGYTSKLFGSWQNFLVVADASAGGEDDIREDWEDYSFYSKMIVACKKIGVDLRKFNPQKLSKEQFVRLFRILQSETGAPQKQIEKFLNVRKT